MMEDQSHSELIFTMGFRPASYSRIRGIKGRFSAAANREKVQQYVGMELGLMAHIVANKYRELFIAAGHNKTDETLRSLRIDVDSIEAMLSVGGGAIFIDFGTSPHWVGPIIEGGVLAWQDTSGATFFSRGHEVAGIPAEHLMDKAREEADVRPAMRRIATRFFDDLTGVARSREGYQYTGGQQLPGGQI